MNNVRFWVRSSRYMLVEIITNTKTQLICLSEYYQKLFLQVSYLFQVFSYGQVTMALTPRHKSLQTGLLLTTHVSQEAHPFPHAQGKKQHQNKSKLTKNSPHTYSSTFINSKAIEDFKIRLFNGLYTFWQNKRLRWGLITLLILAPISKFFYLLLPEQGFGEYFIEIGSFKINNFIEVTHDLTIEQPGDWFYTTLYWYFFSVGELLAPLVSIFGIFLLFPKQYYPSYLVGVPFGYYLSMVVHRAISTSREEFMGGVGTTMILTFLFLGVVIFMVSDKMLFKQNHRKRASEARIIGLINMPGMTWEEKELIIKKEVSETLKTNNELFVKEDYEI